MIKMTVVTCERFTADDADSSWYLFD